MGFHFTHTIGRRTNLRNRIFGTAQPPDLSVADLPTDGLLAEWRFDEGGGSQVNDQVGNHAITLNSEDQPEWTERGLTFRYQMIQSPIVTNARTLVVLYRQTLDDAASIVISGGSHSSDGIYGNYTAPATTVHVGSGNGVSPLVRRASGQASYRLNRGGWLIAFLEFGQNYNTPFGFGGRHSHTGFRSPEAEVAWAGVYDRPLSSQERDDIYSHVRGNYGRPRNIRVDWRDCDTQVDTVLLWGQSNAGGRALIEDLSQAQRDRLPSNVMISSSRLNSYSWQPPTLFRLGINQLSGIPPKTPDVMFGPETGAAYAWEDARPAQPFFIQKTTMGGTELASVTEGAAYSAGSWNPNELPTSGGYYRALKDWWTSEQAMLMTNMGPRVRQLWWVQGENDATDQQLSDAYRQNLDLLWSSFKTNTGYNTEATMVLAQLSNHSSMPYSNTVQNAITDFVADNADTELIETANLPGGDPNDIHYKAQKQIALGESFYANLP